MTGIGKLLLVFNAVLAISFMALAASVYQAQTSWRAKAETAQSEVTKLRNEVTSATGELTAAKAAADESVAAAENQARELDGRLQGVLAERDALETKNNRLEQELLTQTGLAEAKAQEAQFRKEQAQEQSQVNLSLREQLDNTSTLLRDSEDANFGRKLEFDQLLVKYEGLLDESGDLRKALKAGGLTASAEALAGAADPPPPVDGRVLQVRNNKAGNADLVALSIGGDDGLREGHELAVVRPAVRNQGRAKFLGTVKIIRVDNDSSVGRVVDRTKTGIIEVQDNVTSRL